MIPRAANAERPSEENDPIVTGPCRRLAGKDGPGQARRALCDELEDRQGCGPDAGTIVSPIGRAKPNGVTARARPNPTLGASAASDRDGCRDKLLPWNVASSRGAASARR